MMFMNRNTHHTFNRNIAKELGINQAVILENMMFWLEKNEANNTNYHEGKYWTYNSIPAYAKIFNYLSERQIKYALDELERKGIIETGNFNKKGFDRTKWYTITEWGYSYIQSVCLVTTKCSDHDYKVYPPIPDINTDINTDTKDLCVIDKFNEFWDKYDKKLNRKGAERSFKNHVKDEETFNLIMEDLDRRQHQESWVKDNGQFRPHPTTYLNGHRWQDEYEIVEQEEEFKYEGEIRI